MQAFLLEALLCVEAEHVLGGYLLHDYPAAGGKGGDAGMFCEGGPSILQLPLVYS